MTLPLLLLQLAPLRTGLTGQRPREEGTHINVEVLREPCKRVEGQIFKTSLDPCDVVRREVKALGKSSLRPFPPASGESNSAAHLFSKVVCWGRVGHAPKLVDPTLKVN